MFLSDQNLGNLEGLASVLEGYLGTYRAKVLRLLTDCAVILPEKCTIYSTLVGLLNTKNYNFGGEVNRFDTCWLTVFLISPFLRFLNPFINALNFLFSLSSTWCEIWKIIWSRVIGTALDIVCVSYLTWLIVMLYQPIRYWPYLITYWTLSKRKVYQWYVKTGTRTPYCLVYRG